MNKEPTYKHSSDSGDPEEKLLQSAFVPWEKSKEDIWKNLSESILKEDWGKNTSRRKLPGKQWLAAAAAIALLLATAGFLRFHRLETSTGMTGTVSVLLPDGTSVELNSNSMLSYQPYWWRISRSVEMEGEAWFRVEPGSKFRVQSEFAITQVLGTSFNVFSRGDQYHVSCHTGRVLVTASDSEERAVLNPGKKAELGDGGVLIVSDIVYRGNVPQWMNRKLLFSATPLRMVFEEIEKQYGIEIDISRLPDLIYSGNFATDIPLENVLTLLCRPFNLRYEETTGNTYIIYPAP